MDQSTVGFDAERMTTIGLLFESSAGLRRLFMHQLDSDPLVTTSFDVLIRLMRSPGHTLRMSELATQASLTPSGLTRSIDRLAQHGLVSRETCPEDRRGTFAALTAQGHAVMTELLPRHLASIDEILDEVFTPAEEAELSRLLRKLRDFTQTANARSGSEPLGDCGKAQ